MNINNIDEQEGTQNSTGKHRATHRKTTRTIPQTGLDETNAGTATAVNADTEECLKASILNHKSRDIKLILS